MEKEMKYVMLASEDAACFAYHLEELSFPRSHRKSA